MKNNMSVVERFGLALFLVGLVLFAIAPLIGHNVVTEAALERLEQSGVIKEAARATVMTELQPLIGRSYSGAWALLPEVNKAIDSANESLPSDAKIWDYGRQQIRIAIAGETSVVTFPGGLGLQFLLSFCLAAFGALLFVVPRIWTERPGIRHNGMMTSGVKSRGALGIAAAVFLVVFYILLYFNPEYIVGWIRLGDPVSYLLRGQPSSQWFFYGLIYTFAVLVMGVRMLVNYRHSRYHLIRTASVMFFQLGFAFLIPAVLASMNKPEIDFKNAWPLDYSFFYSYRLEGLMSGGAFGWFVLFWGIGLSLIVVPLLSHLVGKRWYCSWVCGCGGLAETLGDPFRHLSSKKLKAWKLERVVIHSVLVFAVVMTVVVVVNFLSGRSGDPMLGSLTEPVKKAYGFFISSIFAGVVGTGFYPVLGNRVWCRFGCPLAAILGIVQRFKSRFRITTNGGQCISCGNCSTYCEMGIDVRSYAQRGLNIIRASCVGCGVCSAVCPRGVLRLENGPEEGRFEPSPLIQIGAGPLNLRS